MESLRRPPYRLRLWKLIRLFEWGERSGEADDFNVTVKNGFQWGKRLIVGKIEGVPNLA